MPSSDHVDGAPAVHSLDHFAIVVPDLTKALHFYSGFGIDIEESGNGLALRAAASKNPSGFVFEGDRKKLHHLSFGIYGTDASSFIARLEQLGIVRLDPPSGLSGEGLWFRDPEGNIIELRIAEKTSPDAKTPVSFTSSAPGSAGASRRSTAPKAKPRRLSHVLLFARDVLAQARFYSEVLGLRLTDHSADIIAFLHAPHGSDHHVIAFAKSGAPGFHHSSWVVSSIDEIGLGAMQMTEAGFRVGWGLGRHVIGSNYFHYVRDPWSSWCEYTCDLDYVPKGMRWQAQDYPMEDAIYVWGPTMPDDFIVNHELAA